MKKLLIVVVGYQGGEDLIKCLESLRLAKVPSGWSKKVVVIDNNQTNRGFAKAANIGLKKAIKDKTEAVMLLNQDTVVEKDFLIPLLKNSADIVGPVIKFRRGGKWVYDYGGKINWLFGRTVHLESQKAKVKRQNNNLKFKNIDYISGCAMLIRRPVMEKIGLMDERYFLYFEDVDFCLRAKKAGFKIAVEPKSQIVHHLKDPQNRPFRQRWHLWKSNLLFVNRWLGWPQKLLAYVYLVILLIKLLI